MPQQTDHNFNIKDSIPLFNPRAQEDKNTLMHLEIECGFYRPVRDQEDYAERAKRAFQTEVATALKNSKLKAFSSDLKSAEIASWIKRRLEQKIPAAVQIRSIHIACEYLDPASAEHVFGQAGETSVKTKRIFATAANPPSALHAKKFTGFLYEAALQSKFADSEQYFSRQDARQIYNLIANSRETGATLNFVTFICPPYVKPKLDKANKNYNSIHPDFSDPPSSYNFDYDYHEPIEVMKSIQMAAERNGIDARSYIVFGDWGLICIDEIFKTLKSEEKIKENLSLFYQGMNGYVENFYPDVHMTSFQSIGAQQFMPIGLPFSSQVRLEWLRNFSDPAQTFPAAYEGLPQQKSELSQLLKIMDDEDMIEKILDWRNYDACYGALTNAQAAAGGHLSKAGFIEIAKVYGSVYQIRKKEETGGSFDKKELRKMALIDTLIRKTQYQIYSRLFSKKYGGGVCIYSDPKFSSCGHFFRHENMAVAFVDSDKILKKHAPEISSPADPLPQL